MRLDICILAALLLLGTGAAAARGGAPELETLLIEDEANGLAPLLGGYDVTRVFLGEAHLREVGAGAAGDGFYFRATLGGDFSSPLAGQARVVFEFDTPRGPAERFFETIDGRTFRTDFDSLLVATGADGLEVERAFVSYQSLGIAPGARLTAFRVTSESGGEPRDVAPGGIFLPGPLGEAAEIPFGPSRVVSEERMLAGVGGYAAVAIFEESTGVFAVTVRSLLEEVAQQVTLREVAAQPGWRIEPLDEPRATIRPGEAHTFRLRLVADAPAAALRLDVLTDAGGRVGLVADNARNVLTLGIEDADAVTPAGGAQGSAPVPAPGHQLTFAAVAAAAAVATAFGARHRLR